MKTPENLYKDISHHSGSIGVCGIEPFSCPAPQNDDLDFQIQQLDWFSMHFGVFDLLFNRET